MFVNTILQNHFVHCELAKQTSSLELALKPDYYKTVPALVSTIDPNQQTWIV